MDSFIIDIKNYLSENEGDLSWDGFFNWAMFEQNIDLHHPVCLLENYTKKCSLISYRLGYPSGSNNIGWNEYEASNQLNQEIDIVEE